MLHLACLQYVLFQKLVVKKKDNLGALNKGPPQTLNGAIMSTIPKLSMFVSPTETNSARDKSLETASY